MSRLKRTLGAIFVRVDQVIGEIENQEAVIAAAIDDHARKITRAKVECSRLSEQATKVAGQVEALGEKHALWESRAIREADKNESRALACIQQAELAAQQIERLAKMEVDYRNAVEKMAREIRKGETQLQELRQKHQLLKARQLTADAMGQFREIDGAHIDDIEASFDRWEVKIGHAEYDASPELFDVEAADLEGVFVREENEVRLRARLDELRDHSGAGTHE